MKPKAINDKLTYKNQLGIDTDPPISGEVVGEMKKRMNPEDDFEISHESGTLLVRGVLLGEIGQAFFERIHDLVATSYQLVVEEATRAHNSRQAMLKRLSQESGLPVSQPSAPPPAD